METTIQKKPVWLSIIRWSARIIALLFAIVLCIMFISEDMSPFYRNAALFEKHYFILSLWILTPIGYLIGQWREGPKLLNFVNKLILMTYKQPSTLSDGLSRLSQLFQITTSNPQLYCNTL